jgi:hypothetical protein
MRRLAMHVLIYLLTGRSYLCVSDLNHVMFDALNVRPFTAYEPTSPVIDYIVMCCFILYGVYRQRISEL